MLKIMSTSSKESILELLMAIRIKWKNVCVLFDFLNCIVCFSNEADNPVFDGMYDFCSMYCGASIGKLFLSILSSF